MSVNFNALADSAQTILDAIDAEIERVNAIIAPDIEALEAVGECLTDVVSILRELCAATPATPTAPPAATPAGRTDGMIRGRTRFVN